MRSMERFPGHDRDHRKRRAHCAEAHSGSSALPEIRADDRLPERRQQIACDVTPYPRLRAATNDHDLAAAWRPRQKAGDDTLTVRRSATPAPSIVTSTSTVAIAERTQRVAAGIGVAAWCFHPKPRECPSAVRPTRCAFSEGGANMPGDKNDPATRRSAAASGHRGRDDFRGGP